MNKRATGYQGMMIAGIVWGITVFFLIKIFDKPPYWISLLGASAVFLTGFFLRNIFCRAIASDGNDLVISNADQVRRIPKDQILFYKIERISSLNLLIVMRNGEEISVPIDGFFSEGRIVGIFDSLGVSKS